MRRRSALVVVAALTCLAMATGTSLAASGDVGHDVSQSDCSSLPTGAFGVVAVTGDPADGGGRPYNQNPCLAAEAQWAADTGAPSLYLNTANPGPTSTHWPTTPAAQHVPCHDAASLTDAGCAYDYGWNAASDALTRAGTTITAFNPLAVTWWLDVESGNSWKGSSDANAADVQGYVDRLRTAGVPSVGLYAASQQWVDITGGFTRSTAAGYRARWGFPTQYPMDLSPTWLPGSADLAGATNACQGSTFTGSPPLLAQYPDGSHDGDVACATESTDTVAPHAAMTAPTGVTLSTRVVAGWTADGAVTSYDVRYRQANPGAGFSAFVLPANLQVTGARAAAITSPYGYTACFSVRARDARPNLSAWSAERCSVVPLDDRALTASAGWTRATSSAYFASTYSTTTRYGATLSRTRLQSTRLSLVATRCPTCGVVGVYLGSTLLAKVDLRAGTTVRKAVLALPRFTLRSTTVTVKVLSTGKTVQIDGLSSSRV